MSVTAELVKELRERTGAGMMECKKALVESHGDIEAAIVAMRKAGQAKVSKKSGRVAAEGVVVARVSADAKQAVVVEVNCETDFVARDTGFRYFAEHVADCALINGCLDPAALAGLVLNPKSDQTVDEARQALILKIGENIQIRRMSRLETTQPGAFLAVYQHGVRIGVLVHVQGGTAQLAKDLAMHIAASSPEVVSARDVPAVRIEKEREIYKAQALTEGKPAAILEKMVEGRVKKFVMEISLLGQEFVKDPTKTVEAVLTEHKASVAAFVRYELGEGIEKQKTNFAEEVMAQVRGNEG